MEELIQGVYYDIGRVGGSGWEIIFTSRVDIPCHAWFVLCSSKPIDEVVVNGTLTVHTIYNDSAYWGMSTNGLDEGVRIIKVAWRYSGSNVWHDTVLSMDFKDIV